MAACFELWRRAIGDPGREPFGMLRLTIGTASLLVLLVAPWHEHRRASEAIRVASAIRLRDPVTSVTARATVPEAAMDKNHGLPSS